MARTYSRHILNLKKHYCNIFQMVVSSSFTTYRIWKFQIFHTSSALVRVSLFNLPIHMFLICNFLMTKDTEHLFLCLLDIHISSLKNFSFKYFDNFSLGCVFVFLSFESFLIYKNINPLSDLCFANIFSYPLGCLLIHFSEEQSF